MDNKVKSKVFLDPHFNADGYLAQTYSNNSGVPLTVSQGAVPARSASIQPISGKPLDKSIPVGGFTANRYKEVDPNLKRYGDASNLIDSRKNTTFKFYDDFTKRFDQSHLNTHLRRQY